MQIIQAETKIIAPRPRNLILGTPTPQLGIQQTLTLLQADILQLNSVPVVLVGGFTNFVPIFRSAIYNYRFKTTAFSNVSHDLSVKLVPVSGSPIVVSNLLPGDCFLGLSQNTNTSFIPANPYSATIDDANGGTLVFTIETADPTDGDTGSQITLTFTYDLIQCT